MTSASHYKSVSGHLQELAGVTSAAAFPHLIVIHGESDYMLQKTWRSVRQIWHSFGAGPVSSYDAAGVDGDTLAALSSQGSIFEPTSLAVIEKIEAPGAFADKLKLIAKANRLCLVVPAGKLPETFKRQCQRLAATILHAGEPSPFEFFDYVEQSAKALHLPLARATKELLVEVVGKNPRFIDNELQRLAWLFPKPERPLTPEDVGAYLGFLKEDFAAKVRSHLLEHKNAKAQTLVADLLRRGESPLAILGILAKHCRSALRIQAGPVNQAALSSLPRQLGIQPYLLKSYTQYVRKISEPKLTKALRLCATADRQLKSSAAADELVLAEIIDALN